MVTIHSKPSDIAISSDCVVEGKDTIVKLMVIPGSDGTPWQVEFPDGAPEGLTVEASPSVTRVRWKLGRDHLRTMGVKPYDLRLRSAARTLTVTVAFHTTGEQILGAFIQSLIRIR